MLRPVLEDLDDHPALTLPPGLLTGIDLQVVAGTAVVGVARQRLRADDATLGFARAIGEFGATITFVSSVPGETATLPLAIYSALQRPGGDQLVWRLAAISVALALVALVASEALARRTGRGTHVL